MAPQLRVPSGPGHLGDGAEGRDEDQRSGRSLREVDRARVDVLAAEVATDDRDPLAGEVVDRRLAGEHPGVVDEGR